MALFAYPVVADEMAKDRDRLLISDAMARNGVVSDEAGVTSKRDKASDPAWRYLEEYNDRVAAGTGDAINDPWGGSSGSDELANVGLADGMVGSLSVPRLGQELPLFLDATYEHLDQGVAVITGTSAPLGEPGSNCVIAGHRGWYAMARLRDIEDVEMGDELTIDTLWDTLAYRAVDVMVIDPTNRDQVRKLVAVQPGRDLVTLVTCHPYGHNYQRIGYVFERVQSAPASVDETRPENPVVETVHAALDAGSSPDLVAERWLRVAGLLILAVWLLCALVFVLRLIMRAILGKSRGE